MSNLINSIDQVILENDLPFEWSDKINKELKDISPNKTQKRIDLRKKYCEVGGKKANQKEYEGSEWPAQRGQSDRHSCSARGAPATSGKSFFDRQKLSM